MGGLRIQVAAKIALEVESRRKKVLCPQYKKASELLKVKKIKVNAVKKACPDMGIVTDGPKGVANAKKIKKAITDEMKRQLDTQHKITKTDKRENKVMAAAHEAWKDVSEADED